MRWPIIVNISSVLSVDYETGAKVRKCVQTGFGEPDVFVITSQTMGYNVPNAIITLQVGPIWHRRPEVLNRAVERLEDELQTEFPGMTVLILVQPIAAFGTRYATPTTAR